MITPASGPREDASPAAPTSPVGRLAVGIPLVALAGILSWWAAKDGAYFGVVLLPGLILLCAAFLLVATRSVWPWPVALSAPAKLVLGGLVGLAIWSALSAFWTPAPEVAIADGQRIAGYALAFALGVWLRRLAGGALYLALAPAAIAGLFAATLTLTALLTGSDFGTYVEEGTLRYPLGYRNANAAFFLIALWPAVHLAAARELDWRLRALALAAGTLCLELAMLSQSRGSTIAAGLAVLVLMITSPQRARIVFWLALGTAPALLCIPAIADLHETADLVSYEGTAELRTAGRAALAGALVAFVLGIGAALVDRRREPDPSRQRRADRVVAIGAVAVAIAAGAVFSVATGNPVRWLGDRVDEFLTQGTPEAEGASRFELNAGSERDDLWRVALDAAGDDPLLGAGAGGYEYLYPRLRSAEGPESVRDAHSIELEVLSELGIVGLALLAVVLVGSGWGAWVGRRAGLQAAVVSGCALTAAAYWLAHSSIDWFWTYPAVTAPVFAMLGAACRQPAAPASAGTRRWRRFASLAVVVLALSAIPPFLSERYLDAAYDGWRNDPGRADADLDRARSLNPLAIEPLLAEGAIARAGGRPEAAADAFEEAADKRPEEWAAHYFLAQALIDLDPERAAEAAERAIQLNPLSPQVRALDRRVRRAVQPGSSP